MSGLPKPSRSAAPGTRIARLPLDFLRGAAALTVFAAHACVFWLDAWSTRLPGVLLHAADLAVIVFFVVSGFVIVMSMCRRAAASQHRRLDVQRFARDRARRLLPPLIVALLLTTLCDALLLRIGPAGYEPYWSARLALGVVLFLQGLVPAFEVPLANGSLWSLAHEGWFYLVGIALFAGQRRVLSLIALLVLAAGSAATLGWLPDAFSGETAARWVPGFLVWCAGGALALAAWRGALPVLTGRSRRVATAALSVVLVVLACLSSPWMRYPFGIVLAALLGVVLPAPLDVDGRRNGGHRAASRATTAAAVVVAAVAPFSYTLYIFHYPLILVWNVVTHGWQQSVFGVVMTVLLGSLGIIGICAVAGVRLERAARA